jgi:hypothetical protein
MILLDPQNILYLCHDRLHTSSDFAYFHDAWLQSALEAWKNWAENKLCY